MFKITLSMKKLCSFIAALLFMTLSSSAQIAVSGKIVNEKQEPLPFASVALLAAKDSQLIKGALTDETGAYSIPSVSAGFYRIMTSSVGYDKAYSSSFTVKEDSKNATVDMVLQPSATVLKEAVVTATRPLFEQKTDRLVMNVANSPVAAGGTALEILQKMPGVIVAQERVTLAGSQNVQIWIDGKPSQYTDMNTVLRDMPGDQIDRIELIRQPGAQYDAAGGPILNIILKRNAELGLTGTASLTLVGSTFNQNDVGLGQKNYYRYSPALNLNYRSGQWNVFGSYSYINRQVFQIMLVDRFIGSETYKSHNYTDQAIQFHNYRVGADFYATKKTTIGFLLRGWSRGSDDDGSNVTDVWKKDLSQRLNSFVTDNLSTSNRSNVAGNFNVKHEFNEKTGHTLNFDADYNQFQTDNLNNLAIYKNEVGSTKSFLKQNLTQPVSIFVTKLDYSLPIDSTFKADIGTKLSFATIDNDLKFYRGTEIQTGQSNDFLYKENINAGYLNLSKKMGKKVELTGGIRAEQTIATGTSMSKNVLDRKYLQWFPSASAMYKFNEHLGLQASYSKRVNRPGFQQQNPFVNFIDSLTYTKGNPSLKPEIIHTGQLAVVYDGQPFVSAAYTKIDDVIIENAPLLEGTKTFTTAANLARNENWTFQLNFPVKLGKWLDGYGGNQAVYNAYNADYQGSVYNASRWHWLVYTGLNVKLPQGIKMEINGWYMTKFLEEFITIRPLGGISIGASKSFWDNRGKLSLNVNDIFYSQNSKAAIDFGNVVVNFAQRGDSRQARLTFGYTFGNTKVKNARRRSTASESETSRIKVE